MHMSQYAYEDMSNLQTYIYIFCHLIQFFILLYYISPVLECRCEISVTSDSEALNKDRANSGPIFLLYSVVLILTSDLLCVVCIAPTLHPHTVTLRLHVYCTLCCLYVTVPHEAKVIAHASFFWVN